MNEAYSDFIYNGVLLCINIQLVLLAIFYVFKQKLRLFILGVFCFLVAALYINNLFWGFVKESVLLSILVGGGKNIFFGPLVYLYVSTALLPKEQLWQHITKHLTLPVIIHSVYLIIKFGFSSFYSQNAYWVVTILDYLLFGILLFYLTLGIIVLRGRSSTLLSVKVKRKYFYFLSILLGYYSFVKLYTIISSTVNTGFFADNFLTFNRYFFSPLAFIAKTYILLFALTEHFKFKSFFAPKKIRRDHYINETDDESINDKLQEELIGKKLYASPTLTIAELARKLGVGKESLQHYFKNNGTTFKGYLNSIRIEAFKNLLDSEGYQSYTLSGLSTLVGFRSDATFFRVFKKVEGITPAQYHQQIKKD